MIGLEYILGLYNIPHTELAKELNISRQNINLWIKGKSNIPEKYLPILSKKFQVPEGYFQMDADIIKNIYVEALNKAIDNIDEPYKQSLVQLRAMLEHRN